MPLRWLSLPFDILVLVFMASAALSLLPAYDRAAGWPVLAAVLAAGGVYFAAAHLIASGRAARRFGLLLVVAALFYTLLFILLYGHQHYIETPDAVLRLGAFTTALPDLPIFIHPNSAAAVAVGALPLALALALSSRREVAQRALWWAGAAALGYGLLLTFSRGAFVALALTLLLALLTLILPRRAALLLALLLVAGAAAALLARPLLAPALEWTLSRYDLYRNSLYLAQDYAFTGIGLGEPFALVYARYGLLIQVPFLTHPHNLPLAVWMNQGLLGLVALLALIVTFYLFVLKVTRSAAPHRLFHGAWLGVTATLLHGLFDAQQYSDHALLLLPLLFALIGLTVASGRQALHKAYWQQSEFSLRYIPRPLPVIALLGTLALSAFFRPQLAAAWETNLGALAETRAALTEDLSAAERFALYDEALLRYSAALKHAPGWASASRRLGNLDVTLGEFAAAVPLLEAAAAAEPDNPAAIKGLGLAYTWTGRAQDAAAVFSRLSDPAAMASELSTWGFYRREQGQPLLAAYAWDAMQALNSSAASADVLLLIADTYRSAGESARARQHYQRVLTLDPANAAAREALAAPG